MAAPTTPFTAVNSHLVAVPWTAQFTVAAGSRRRVNFLNVTRSVRVATTATATAAVAFSAAAAAPLAATEHPVSDLAPFDATVQLTGLWLVNRGAAGVVFSVFATLTPDASSGWPVYSAAAGFDAVNEAPAATVDEALA